MESMDQQGDLAGAAPMTTLSLRSRTRLQSLARRKEAQPCIPSLLERPRDLSAALAFRAQAGRNDAPAEYIAGGTDMVQLLQEYVRRPRTARKYGEPSRRAQSRIVHSGGLRLGAAATMAEVAVHPGVVEQFPLISEALVNSASPQVRNQATMGGNVLQRTRCPYFRDVAYEACNKRTLGSGCAALDAENRWHAVLGTSDNCIAAHPWDPAVALVALDAAVRFAAPAVSGPFRSQVSTISSGTRHTSKPCLSRAR